jgi:hypothetical protein
MVCRFCSLPQSSRVDLRSANRLGHAAASSFPYRFRLHPGGQTQSRHAVVTNRMQQTPNFSCDGCRDRRFQPARSTARGYIPTTGATVWFRRAISAERHGSAHRKPYIRVQNIHTHGNRRSTAQAQTAAHHQPSIGAERAARHRQRELDSPAAMSGGGTVTVQFLPAGAGASDPAIAFASGGQTAPFTFQSGRYSGHVRHRADGRLSD